MEVSRVRSILVTKQNNFKKETLQVIAEFCPFVRTSPIHFALLGRKRKYIKSETTAKLIEKRTSIAAVPDKLGQIDTFLTPLLSGCRLPLKPSLAQLLDRISEKLVLAHIKGSQMKKKKKNLT